jgi:hypothetical protein
VLALDGVIAIFPLPPNFKMVLHSKAILWHGFKAFASTLGHLIHDVINLIELDKTYKVREKQNIDNFLHF